MAQSGTRPCKHSQARARAHSGGGQGWLAHRGRGHHSSSQGSSSTQELVTAFIHEPPDSSMVPAGCAGHHHANGPPAAGAGGRRIEVLCRGGERVAVPRERAEKCAFLLGILEECEADDAAGPLTVQAPLVEAPRLEAVLRILGGERAGAGMCVCTYCTMLYHAQSAT